MPVTGVNLRFVLCCRYVIDAKFIYGCGGVTDVISIVRETSTRDLSSTWTVMVSNYTV